MEISTDFSDELQQVRDSTRSPLCIDLNEIPSSSFAETLPFDSDAYEVVYIFHDNPLPPPGGPAGVPGDSHGLCCGACGRPEVRGQVVVCDGCERGFHLSCTGMQGRQVGNFEEWVCGECLSSGVKSKQWPLGVKSKQILDINASPPSDTEELQDLRKHTLGDNSFGGNPFGAPATYSNLLHAGNEYGYQNAFGLTEHAFRVGFQDILNHTQSVRQSLDEVDLVFPLRKLSNNTAIRLPPRNPSEVFLQALRDFIYERHGVLGEGWHVEFKQSFSNYEIYAIYCAPDGKTFDSMSEVACYLGLMSNCSSVAPEVVISRSRQERPHLPKKRKSTKLSVSNGFGKETLLSDYYKVLSSEGQQMDICCSKFENSVTVPEVRREDNIGSGSQLINVNDGLPLRFEDFFVLSLGQVDTRSLYHDVSQIWPVGYRSCWHDQVTGSFFTCEVLEGGDSGPLFKVKRGPCSALPIPKGSTVLITPLSGQGVGQTDGESDRSMDLDDTCDIEMMLLDSSAPSENDILSCLEYNLNQVSDAQMANSSQHGANIDVPNIFSSDDSESKDDIGEILVEEHSSSSAWRVMCQKMVQACSDSYKQKGTLSLFCEHGGNKMCSSSYTNIMDEKSRMTYISLAKFCSSPGAVDIPSLIQGDKELNTFSDVLEKWLDQDRFGLDTEFVQEFVEQLPGVQSCSGYEYLDSRCDHSSQPMVGNSLLLVKSEGGVQGEKKEADGIFRIPKKAKLVGDPSMDIIVPPPGKLVCPSLPSQLVGDVYEVWELFCRFHEILGFKEPLSVEELEAELINPWSNGPNHLKNLTREIHGSLVLDSDKSKYTGDIILSKSDKASLAASSENPHVFIQMDTGATKEADQARLASSTYTRCTGVTLLKAHKSLLRVVMTELQLKVAALVDPNFNAGEPKSKRGRKRDTDSSIPARSTKLNMLPINELTWPELARRYVLVVLSMDGNLDSVDITARESVKVFRCLLGDGGTLCGSLTGVAGMEADALLLAEATKQIFGSLNRENDVLTIEDTLSDANVACERSTVSNGGVPEWAKPLEPVRKLPTNVGTRIRKCVYEALEKDPPEWAKNILEHSISKEVYKGNASGPTKKAVLSLLADVTGVGLVQKSDKVKKRKTVISASEIIMKRCRIVLRCAAAADDAKIFCNLLGRKLISHSDNDDEGLLGSPAMVSRPLDFRTIDLRLAVGAYGGSHEAFLEDIRELWNNIRSAYGDQQDLVELAETLSQNFESLYENEVAPLIEKLVEYSKLECLDAEKKKEIHEFLSSSSDIIKAPWDEGVCKVCGIDKDDDSVLLCDTCDGEYHTYCLNPPLARIPDGNWYCPSCVVGKGMVQDALRRTEVIGKGRKYSGEVTRVFLEALTHLETVMEEKEYWQFSVNERTFLLKFLCDEVLNSALIRQNLEQSAETTVELQQKLRASSLDWRNLKSREEILAARSAKINTSALNTVRIVGIKDVSTTITNGTSSEQPHSSRYSPNGYSVISNNLPSTDNFQEGIGNQHSSVTCESKTMDAIDTKGQLKDENAIMVDDKAPGSLVSHVLSEKVDQTFKPNDLPLSMPFPQESDDLPTEIPFQECIQECSGRDVLNAPSPNNIPQQGPAVTNDLQSLHLIQNEISVLEESIKSTESQLRKLSVRREFLGCDSCGRLYWASAIPGMRARIIVDGSVTVMQRNDHRGKVDSILEGSEAPCPYLYQPNNPRAFLSPWVSYETDEEMRELVGWLKDTDSKERELKEAISHWWKINSQCSQEPKNLGHVSPMEFSMSTNSEETTVSNSLVTKATTMLEKKYGHFFESNTIDILKKRRKKARVTNAERMYRCECLEPIWPSRHHCLCCHRTFLTDVELEGHSDVRCNSAPSTSEKNKEVKDSLRDKVTKRSDTRHEECIGEKDVFENVTMGRSQLSSKLIKFQSDGLACPHDFAEISSKFVTRNSNSELTQEIGLIGSNGIPSFVPSLSPYLSDPTLMLASHKSDAVEPGDEENTVERLRLSPGKSSIANAGNNCVSDISLSSLHVSSENMKTKGPDLECYKQKDRISYDSCFPHLVVPQSSLRPLVGKDSHILRQLQINLLDMDAALPEESLKPSKAHSERRWAWRAFVKSAKSIYEMVQATIILEDMVKTSYLRNDWWYWSSLSAGARTSTLSSIALRIYTLDASIIYEKTLSTSGPIEHFAPTDKKPLPSLDPIVRVTRKSNKKRKEAEG